MSNTPNATMQSDVFSIDALLSCSRVPSQKTQSTSSITALITPSNQIDTPKIQTDETHMIQSAIKQESGLNGLNASSNQLRESPQPSDVRNYRANLEAPRPISRCPSDVSCKSLDDEDELESIEDALDDELKEKMSKADKHLEIKQRFLESDGVTTSCIETVNSDTGKKNNEKNKQ